MAIIRVEEKDNYFMMHLEGDFVGGDEINDLRENLRKYATLEKNRLIVDLRKVSYANSTALGVFLSANAFFERNKGKIVLCNLSDYLVNIFTITKLTFIFTLYKTAEEAAEDVLKNE